MEVKFCPTVRPTAEEFNNFYQFVHKLDQIYKKQYGMVKVVPPPQWISKAKDYQNRLENIIIKKPIQQNVQGKGGFFESKNIIQNKITFKSYKKYSIEQGNKCANKTIEQKEKLFWKTLAYSPPVYAADIPATLMDEASRSWYLNDLNSVLKHSFSEKIKGVNESYCYIGSWKSFFSWHKQDLDLAALNFIHQGQPKVWYSIAESDFWMLEQLAKKYFKNNYQQCHQFMRHKTFLIHPQILVKAYPDIKITKMIHNQGEFMLVFGGAYHCGFNCGFNIAEAVNYATVDWFKNLLTIKCCTCTKKSVRAEVESVLYNLQNSNFVNYQGSIFDDIMTLESFQSLQYIVQENQMLEEKQAQANKEKQEQKEKEIVPVIEPLIIEKATFEKSMTFISQPPQKIKTNKQINLDSDYEIQNEKTSKKKIKKMIKKNDKQQKVEKHKKQKAKKQPESSIQNKQTINQGNSTSTSLLKFQGQLQILEQSNLN